MPMITNPAISKIPPATAAELISIGTKNQKPTFVNIHIPFYITHCLFCHWVINQNTRFDEIAQYLKCLDLVFVRHRQRYENTGKINASSIRVGGDTPTSLSPTHMKMFFDIIHKHINMDDLVLFSYENVPLNITRRHWR